MGVQKDANCSHDRSASLLLEYFPRNIISQYKKYTRDLRLNPKCHTTEIVLPCGSLHSEYRTYSPSP